MKQKNSDTKITIGKDMCKIEYSVQKVFPTPYGDGLQNISLNVSGHSVAECFSVFPKIFNPMGIQPPANSIKGKGKLKGMLDSLKTNLGLKSKKKGVKNDSVSQSGVRSDGGEPDTQEKTWQKDQ
jgi:hypothetical protein